MLAFPTLLSLGFGGIYVPIHVLPDAVRRIIELLPFGAAAQALNQAASGSWPAWSHLAVLAAVDGCGRRPVVPLGVSATACGPSAPAARAG